MDGPALSGPAHRMPRRLLLLSGLAIAATLLFHAEGWGFTGLFAWAHRYLPAGAPLDQQAGSAGYYGLRAIEQLVAFAIPAFLFVSGFFVAFSTRRHKPTIEWDVVRQRVQHVAVPYVFWSIVLWAGMWLEGKRFTPAGYLRLMLTGATNPAYYYVPLLIQLYLLAPVIVRLARTRPVALLVVTGLLQLWLLAAAYPDLLGLSADAAPAWLVTVPKWLFATRLFWFSSGVVAGFQVPALKRFLERARWGLLASTIVLFVLGLLEWEWMVGVTGEPGLAMRETVLDAFYAAALILTFLAFGDLRPPVSDSLGALASKSFGIYLVHSPVMTYLARGLYHVAPWLLGQPVLLVPVLIAAGLGVPLLLMQLVSRSPARPLYVYQFG